LAEVKDLKKILAEEEIVLKIRYVPFVSVMDGQIFDPNIKNLVVKFGSGWLTVLMQY